MMKKLCLLFLVCLLLAGCMAEEPSVDAPSFQTTVPTAHVPQNDDGLCISYADVWEPIGYDIQYIRTNGGYDAARQYPLVVSVGSKAELEAYYEANRETYDLERKEQVYADTTIGFLDACDRYDDAFFADHNLLLILLEEGSGSIRHSVETVLRSLEGMLRVKITRQVPEVCTDDMAQWHLILEVGKKMPGAEDVQVYLDEKLAWDGRFVEPPKPEAEFKAPPAGMVRTAMGEATLTLAGFEWNYENPDSTVTSVVADQTARPLPTGSLTPVGMDPEYLETVYLPVPGESYYAPVNQLGYLVKLNWEKTPSDVTCTRFIDDKAEQIPFSLEGPFYTDEFCTLYEFEAVWKDAGSDCWGRANYYLYIGTLYGCS